MLEEHSSRQTMAPEAHLPQDIIAAEMFGRLSTLKKAVTCECSPNDTMLFNNDMHAYLTCGYTAMRHIVLALIMAGKGAPLSILDLPCGHGRVMRWLRAMFPDSKITASELDPDGVDFCAEKFGAKKLYSHPNPGEIDCKEKFDLIWCGSLLTHLSEKSSLSFLDFFKNCLQDDGIMIVTFHGRGKLECRYSSLKALPKLVQKVVPWIDFRKVTRGLKTSGFGHSAAWGKEYGTSFTYPHWIARWIESDPGFRVVYFNEGGFGYTQDVLALQKTAVAQRLI